MGDFAGLTLDASLLAAFGKLGIETPTEIQRLALPPALEGKDLIVIAETGSGKTLLYLLTALRKFQQNAESRALILAPSREMASQIHRVFESLAPSAACLVIGGMPDNKQAKQLNKMPRAIVATPGRMNDLLTNNKALLQRVDLIVVDEADRMLDLGFLPQLKSIRATMRGTSQILLISASWGPEVEAVVKVFATPDAQVIRSTGAENPVAGLSQRVVRLSKGSKNERLLIELKEMPGRAIVFAATQEAAERIHDHLRRNGITSEALHGQMVQGHRARAMRDFRDGKSRVLVTTDLLARGLDVPDIDLVINYDLPPEPEDFLHRVGRTARAGRSGAAVTFLTPGDRDYLRPIRPYLAKAEELTWAPADHDPAQPRATTGPSNKGKR